MTSPSREKPRYRTSITVRLYFVVGIMGALIALELVTLRFAMIHLSAVRAFVGGESLWSKAQKNAVFSLQRYATTRDPRDYRQYEQFLAVPQGDHIARLELFKPEPDLSVVRRGFLQGKLHPDDIDPMIELLRRFGWVKQLQRAIEAWTAADEHLETLVAQGGKYRTAVARHDEKGATAIMNRVKELNGELTELEEEFSNALGDGSRYLERVVLGLLTLAVIMVESVGLTLAIITARSLARGLRSLASAAREIGEGRFEYSGLPHAKNEIGDLADSLRHMGALLGKSYGELELRVRERTADLARLANENASLYGDTSRALERRDEFLSLASHELKTPITSMLLQAQLLQHRGEARATPEQVQKFAAFMERQLLRINGLVEEMLDTSRIDLSKLSLRIDALDLSALLKETCQRLQPQFDQANTPLVIDIEPAIVGRLDGYRVEQVLTNLLTNTLKYAAGKPVRVEVVKVGSAARLCVTDQGPGVPTEDRDRIFGRFERGIDPTRIGGLGIGLYIARAITAAHGGTLTVENSAEGGARFTAVFPLGSQT